MERQIKTKVKLSNRWGRGKIRTRNMYLWKEKVAWKGKGQAIFVLINLACPRKSSILAQESLFSVLPNWMFKSQESFVYHPVGPPQHKSGNRHSMAWTISPVSVGWGIRAGMSWTLKHCRVMEIVHLPSPSNSHLNAFHCSQLEGNQFFYIS